MLGEMCRDKTFLFKAYSILYLPIPTAINKHHEILIHAKGPFRNAMTKNKIYAARMQASVSYEAPLVLPAFRVAIEAEYVKT
jgi:hypothetical protein